MHQFRFVLEGAQTIRTIDAVRNELLEVMARHRDIVIDCSATTDVDVSLVQLLLAARLSAARNGQLLSLSRPIGEALRATLQRGGFLSGDPSRQGGDAAFWLGEEGDA